ncbi:MAG TPA: nucleoside hydrolase [Bryobacteraceae bacterium]|nr:nucleoside hydrolase [Bryobacteraceae bacterium]
MDTARRLSIALPLLTVLTLPLHPVEKRKVIIDEDCSGPGGTNMQAVLTLVNAPQTDVLGITVPTGDAYRDEEVQHALRLLEVIGRTEIPVVPGAVFPLVNRKEFIAQWEKQYGKVVYQGAWNTGTPVHGPYEIPPMPEGTPTAKASTEDAAHFLVRMVRHYPREITIYAAGPLTDLAQALTLDPRFAQLAKELIVMGGSIHPITNDPEFTATPHREFNFWMDPEASHAVLHARWRRIVLTTVDISVKTRMDQTLIADVAKSPIPAAQYVAKYAMPDYLWDELAAAAWLDSSIITSWEKMYIDVSIDHGSSYGDTLAWKRGRQPGHGERLVEVQQDLDKAKFYREYVALLKGPALTKRGRGVLLRP